MERGRENLGGSSVETKMRKWGAAVVLFSNFNFFFLFEKK
jgi:hypothetical protein